MSIRGIDISNHQQNISLEAVQSSIQFLICKASEGVAFTDPYYERWSSWAIAHNMPLGLYHYARNNNAKSEATYFYERFKSYIGQAVPILDWEEGQPASWVNEWCKEFERLSGVIPWIYSNPRFFTNAVDTRYPRWLAAYPYPYTYLYASLPAHPNASGNVVAWQFSSSVRVPGYGSNLDGNIFYGSQNDFRKWYNSGKKLEKGKNVIPIDTHAYELYRAYDGAGHHLMGDKAEVDSLVKRGWKNEGKVAYIDGMGTIPVWRLYNPYNGDHLYTMDYAKAKNLENNGWNAESVPFFAKKNGIAIYRLYNKNDGQHHFTSSEAEYNKLIKEGWNGEGVGFYI